MATAASDPTQFFPRVKRTLDSRETYNEFLSLVNLFTQDIIDTGRLVRDSRNFLGDGELMAQWREILDWDDLKEKAWIEAEAGSGEGMGTLAQRGGVLNRPSRAQLNQKYGSYRKLPASVSLSSHVGTV